MRTQALALGTATAALLAVGACNKPETNANGAPKAQTSKAAKVAGTKTIAAGLAAGGRFMATAKAAGLDQTLAGPAPTQYSSPMMRLSRPRRQVPST